MTNVHGMKHSTDQAGDAGNAHDADAMNHEELHRLREKLRANGEKLEADLRDAGARFSEGAKKLGEATAQQVREHPLAAFGIAFAAGVVVSRWLRGR